MRGRVATGARLPPLPGTRTQLWLPPLLLPPCQADGGGDRAKGGGGGAEKRSRRDEEDQSYYRLVGMKEANHFRTMVFLVMLERSGGKMYSNFANATASPPTCVMP